MEVIDAATIAGLVGLVNQKPAGAELHVRATGLRFLPGIAEIQFLESRVKVFAECDSLEGQLAVELAAYFGCWELTVFRSDAVPALTAR